MKLKILEDTFGVCQIPPDSKFPSWINTKNYYSVSRTEEELSIVCQQDDIPNDVKSEKDWKIIKVEGVLDFSLTGVLASILAPLAAAKISIFAVSTFDTDYILIKNDNLENAKKSLISAGFSF